MKFLRVLISACVITSCLFTADVFAQDASNKVTLGDPQLTAGIPGRGKLTEAQIDKWLSNAANHAPLEISLPFGLSAGAKQIVGVKENPMTRAKIELGRQLYFDPRLSKDNSVSCASCHHPQEGYGRHTQFGVGVGGAEGGRNSPISYNRILSSAQFWDGRAASLEDQARGPIQADIEMGNTHEAAVATVKSIPGYVKQFNAVYGNDKVNIDNVVSAIATFERAIVTGPSAFDYYEAMQRYSKIDSEDLADLKDDNPKAWREYLAVKRGAEEMPMNASAVRGHKLFFSQEIGCSACHVGANLADEKYHNLGVGMDKPNPDLGRYAVTKDDKDRGAFKTPTIRNVALSAPYMHDGSQQTLEEVVEHYVKGGTPNPYLSDKIKKLKVTTQDKLDLVEFMRACTVPSRKSSSLDYHNGRMIDDACVRQLNRHASLKPGSNELGFYFLNNTGIEIMTKRVLDVGQCDPDHSSISRMLTSKFADVQIDRAHLLTDAMDAVRKQSYDLVLINRLLDRDHSEGAEILKLLKSDEALNHIPVIIVSNFPEAQTAAVELGAEPGFGKSKLNAPETLDILGQLLAD